MGMVDVGDGHSVHWEVWGNPSGKPAVMLHGGPGSGCGPFWRQFFDPNRYRVVMFDQRGCGRSTPHASEPGADLSTNTTQHLIADIEVLRRQLGVERWLVVGGSWGSTLGLAYAEAFPDAVSGMVLFSVVTTSRAEVDWMTRGIGKLLPDAWRRFRDGVAPGARDGDLAAAYNALLFDAKAAVREQAARDWCRWEDAVASTGGEAVHDPRYDDPRFRMAFARLVTHYWMHTGFLEDGKLLRDLDRLRDIPAVLVHGRRDLGAPLDVVQRVHRGWPGSRLVVVDDGGHGASDASMQKAILDAIDGFAPS